MTTIDEAAAASVAPAPPESGQHVVHDSWLIEDFFPAEVQASIFDELHQELATHWSEMHHKGGAVPRLVCLQGDKEDDGWEPLYRHPADAQPPLQPWTPTTLRLRDWAAQRLHGQVLNHALIQLYRNGDDYISEHADKTLDICRHSAIVNVSIGASRTMILRPKKDSLESGTPRPSTRVPLHHGSLFVLGWDTNRLLTHEIRRDKREAQFKSESERAYSGMRISLTLRHVATWVHPASGQLRGQGAPQTRKDLSEQDEEERLLQAFSTENKRSDYDWDELYGQGFAVINFQITNNNEQQEQLPLNRDHSLTDSHPLAGEEAREGSNDGGSAPSSLAEPAEEAPQQHHPQQQGGEARSAVVVVDDKPVHTSTTSPNNRGAPAPPQVALLAIDLQNDFLGDDDPSFFLMAQRGKNPLAEGRGALLGRIGVLMDQVRGGPQGHVVFIRSVYGQVPPEPKPYPHQTTTESNPLPFNSAHHAGTHTGKLPCCVRGTSGAALHPDAAKLRDDNDLVLEKAYYSSFTQTPLHPLLQSWGITHLVLCGVTTNNCVAATVRDAYHLGYRVIVPTNGVAQLNPKTAQETLQKLAPYCHAVMEPEASLHEALVAGEKLQRTRAVPPSKKGQKNNKLEWDGTERLTGLGAGDSLLIPNFLTETEASELWEKLQSSSSSDNAEVEWNQLTHVQHGSALPRLTAYQAVPNVHGHWPAYRCADPQPWHGQYETRPFGPAIRHVKDCIEKVARQAFNWSRILLYRDGRDGMGFHSDKCLDIREGTFIASLSLGQAREYELKPKKRGAASLVPQKVTLRHNTLLLLGPETNRLFLHSIKKNATKQSSSKGDDDDVQPRISITFRDLATWYVKGGWEESYLPSFYGQGTPLDTFAGYQHSCWTRRLWETLGIAGASTLGFVATTALQRKNRGGRPWLGLTVATLAAGSTFVLFQYAKHVSWWYQQERLARVYRLCNTRTLTPLQAKDLLLHGTKIELQPGSSLGISACARDS